MPNQNQNTFSFMLPLLFLGGAITTITMILKDKSDSNPKQNPLGINPASASPELKFSRKKRIYVKRQQHAHKQTQILKGAKQVEQYHKKKATGKKTENKEIQYRIGDKVFIQKIKLPTERAHGLN